MPVVALGPRELQILEVADKKTLAILGNSHVWYLLFMMICTRKGSLYRLENQDSERSSNLPTATQLVTDRAGI